MLAAHDYFKRHCAALGTLNRFVVVLNVSERLLQALCFSLVPLLSPSALQRHKMRRPSRGTSNRVSVAEGCTQVSRIFASIEHVIQHDLMIAGLCDLGALKWQRNEKKKKRPRTASGQNYSRVLDYGSGSQSYHGLARTTLHQFLLLSYLSLSFSLVKARGLKYVDRLSKSPENNSSFP